MKGTLGKFRSVREKSGHRRNKSSEPGSRSRPDSLLSLFKPDAAKHSQKEKEEEDKETAKIEEISKRLAELNYHDMPEEWIRFTLSSKFAAGDVEKALELVQLQEKAFKGIIQPYNPNVPMVGAENRGSVTCYLDSLLFAMFAKLTAFECMLKNDSTQDSQRKLAALLRLWVNMLRSGKLIHSDITEHIQNALAECGWADAKELEQQDTSEAFAFITETLQLPLLALQVDLFHQGKGDTDDHKVVHERLLNLAVPADPDGKGIKLEDCLEEYFNNKVEVLRDSPDDKKDRAKSVSSPRTTIRLVTAEDDPESGGFADGLTLQRRWSAQEAMVDSPIAMTSPTSIAAPALSPATIPTVEYPRPSVRHRSTSIIQRIVVDDKGNVTDSDPNLLSKFKRTGSTVVKAVTIPAWQFFRLIPWHATSNAEPKSDIDVVRQFNQRPVVGICLKRYTMTEQGVPQRHNTFVDIPDSLRLPHFMIVNDKAEAESNELNQEYKLVLQGVVCHRGDSLHSGHYISFARVAPKLLTDNRRHDLDPPPDYEEAQWAKFDDLCIENRVSYVDDIKQSLKEEMPYLLFYQVVPMVDVTSTSTDGSVTEPPSYDESATAVTASSTLPQTPLLEPTAGGVSISRSTSGYFDNASTLAHGSGGPSIRFSSELERPVRLSFDDDPYGTYLKVNGSRRGSVTFNEHILPSPGAHSESASPAITPSDETTAMRLSRSAARFTKSGNKSRPTSQAGEGRISSTMSRLGLTRSSKEPLKDTNGNGGGVAAQIPVVEGLEDQPVIVEEVEEQHPEKEREKEKDKDKDHHILKHHRGKSKSRMEKGKSKDKEGKSTGVPDRECVVM